MAEYNIPQPKYKKCTSVEEVLKVKNDWGLQLLLKLMGLRQERSHNL